MGVTRTAALQARYGVAPSDAYTRRVWAAVTRTPRASTKELAVAVGSPASSYGTVAAALRILRDAGYISFADGARRARKIVIPFVVG